MGNSLHGRNAGTVSFMKPALGLGILRAAPTIGAMPAALCGIGTIVVALWWIKLFPTLRDVERLE